MHYLLQSVLMLLSLLLFTSAQAASWSPTTRIESVTVIEGLNIVRVEVLRNNPVFNPAQCANADFIDVKLDVQGRSAEEQRQMLNSLNMAFITRRLVAFFILDDPADPASCSTVGTGSSIRIATGVRVYY